MNLVIGKYGIKVRCVHREAFFTLPKNMNFLLLIQASGIVTSNLVGLFDNEHLQIDYFLVIRCWKSSAIDSHSYRSAETSDLHGSYYGSSQDLHKIDNLQKTTSFKIFSLSPTKRFGGSWRISKRIIEAPQ